MPRVVSVFLPHWPTDRLRRRPDGGAPPRDVPLVLIGREGRRRLVLAADAAARTLGLDVGMTATQARALVAELALRDADPVGDAQALERLALWMLRRTAPIAAPDPPQGLVLDTSGTEHLHGGEPAMLADIVDRLTTAGITAQAAVADTWGAAHAAARHLARPTAVLPPGGTASLMRDLPIAALRLPPETVAELAVLGLERIGDLEARPRAPLALRFGPEPGRRLDQMMGRLAEPIAPLRPRGLIEVHRSFAEPIAAAESIARATGKLAAELCTRLEARALGARRLDLLFHRVDNRTLALRVGTAAPMCDPKRLTRLLCDRIEHVDPGFGIEIMRLTALLAEPLVRRQTVSDLAGGESPDISDLIDALANRIGGHRLYSFAAHPSDVPERSVRRVPPVVAAVVDTGGGDGAGGVGWPGHWPRPVRLLPHPEPIETVALLPDHPPEAFTWRGVRRRVTCADGPERVFGEWWTRDAELVAVRDYFRVEIEAGERFWIYRAGDGENITTGTHRWFLHGIFG
jgi:protein ImuB